MSEPCDVIRVINLMADIVTRAVALPTDELIKQDSRTRGGKNTGAKSSFFPRPIVDWNELPEKTKEAASIGIFKRCLGTCSAN